MNQNIDSLIENILCQSSTIFERKQFPFILHTSTDEKLIQKRMDAWRNALHEDGKPEEMEKYFQWEEIDNETARRMVSPVDLEKDAPLPAWADVLKEVLVVIQENGFWQSRAAVLLSFAYGNGTVKARAQEAKPFPFDVLLAPFLEVIHRHNSVGAGYEYLSLKAQQTALISILNELSRISNDILYQEFYTFREKQPFGAIIQLVAKSKKEAPITVMRQFIGKMQQGGLLALFSKYPVFARLLAQLTQTWMDTQCVFLSRLAEDLGEIQSNFNKGKKCGKVAKLALSLSDRHRGGYSVIALTFESGLKLVYKPKDLQIESAYNHLLEWLNENGAPIKLYPLKTLVHASYGWVAFAEHEPCRTVLRFYQRMGALLCLVYALEGTDCHEENIIACGEYPVLIDAETLFHHRVEENSDEIRDSASFNASMLLSNSVLRVGLLPGWRMARNRKILYDSSGLGGLGEQDIPYQRKRYVNVNTDAMELVSEPRVKTAEKNVPFVEDGSPFIFEEALDVHIEAICTGFEQMYHFLLQKRADLTNPQGVLESFKENQIRFVFRATQVYFTLYQQAKQLKNLYDGADYSLYLERLARAHLQVEEKPSCFSLLTAERESLCNQDIPFFTASTSSINIEFISNNQQYIIEKYFIAPSYDYVIEQLKQLTKEDLNTQLQIIRSSMYSRFAHQQEKKQFLELEKIKNRIPEQTPIQPETAIAQALTMSKRILEQSISGSDGSLSWFGIQYLPESERFQFGGLGIGIYDGVSGIGLFFAALEKVLRLPEYRAKNYPSFRKEALASTIPIRKALEEKSLQEAFNIQLGAASGLGSFLYTLLKVGKLLDEPLLIEDALEAIQRITTDMIEKDDILDVISGSAGFILCMLALYKETQNPIVLEKASISGRHLLAKRKPTEKGYRVWLTINDKPLSGFSHGASGIAHALLRLYQVTREKELYDAAEEAIAYENSLFSAEEKNWQDLRDKDIEAYMVAWCHGAAGIGLQRAACLDVMDTVQIRQDIEAAIITVQNHLSSLNITQADHLCCGSIGRVACLYDIGNHLNRPDVIQYALQAASFVIVNAAEQGGYKYTSFLPRNMFSATLFQGGAGIGYEMLRLTHPTLIPNILLWE